MIDLPPVAELRRITKSLATLDLILCPEWQFRYYSYNSQWAPKEEMASMRNGSGDEWFLWFHDSGLAALKGLDHESEAARMEGLSHQLRGAVPAEFQEFAAEPAFRWDETTFCYWCAGADAPWEEPLAQVPLQTGAERLLQILSGGPEAYQEWAEWYHEQEVSLAIVEQIFRHQALSSDLIAALSAEVTLEELAEQLAQIGYPTAP